MARSSLVVERRIAASPATVFSFFSDVARWLRWQGIEADIWPLGEPVVNDPIYTHSSN